MSSQLLKQSSVGGSSDVYIVNDLVVSGSVTASTFNNSSVSLAPQVKQVVSSAGVAVNGAILGSTALLLTLPLNTIFPGSDKLGSYLIRLSGSDTDPFATYPLVLSGSTPAPDLTWWFQSQSDNVSETYNVMGLIALAPYAAGTGGGQVGVPATGCIVTQSLLTNNTLYYVFRQTTTSTATFSGVTQPVYLWLFPIV